MGVKSLAVSGLLWRPPNLRVVAARAVEDRVGAPIRLLGLLLEHYAEILQPLVLLSHVLNPEHYRGQPMLVNAALEGLRDGVVVRLQKQPVPPGPSGEASIARLASGAYIRSM
jgi:hypothetical protein